jgi:SAM-dependent methyltransferase
VAGGLGASVDVSLKPRQAFDVFVDELELGLENNGMKIEGLARGGKIIESKAEVGVIDEWAIGRKISMTWHPKSWDTGTNSRFVITFAAVRGGTKVTVKSRGWEGVLGGDGQELLGWFAGEVAAPLISASAPERLGDWITDRLARRPSGRRSRRIYRDPVYHWPNFFAILDVLDLGPGDNLVEIGCGGGAFLHEALKSGCVASAIDHSADMVKLANTVNDASVAKGRLRIRVGDAGELPYPAGGFTHAVMTGVLPFLPDPAKAFREIFRVLRKGGLFVLFTSSKEMLGTPAAPEPVASRTRFYEDEELERLALRAGFDEARVEHPSLSVYAKRAGVPKSDLAMFKSKTGSQLLICRKG